MPDRVMQYPQQACIRLAWSLVTMKSFGREMTAPIELDSLLSRKISFD